MRVYVAFDRHRSGRHEPPDCCAGVATHDHFQCHLALVDAIVSNSGRVVGMVSKNAASVSD
jgi:hypothetical protein